MLRFKNKLTKVKILSQEKSRVIENQAYLSNTISMGVQWFKKHKIKKIENEDFMENTVVVENTIQLNELLPIVMEGILFMVSLRV